MPKATDNNSAVNPPDSEAGPRPTHSHNTRQKSYKYSHFRAPYTPAPARNTNRPPLPPLAARKKAPAQKNNKDNVSNANNTAGENRSNNSVTPHSEPEPSVNSASDNTDCMMGDAVATGTESSRGTEAPDEVTNSNQPVLAGLTTIPEEIEAPPSDAADAREQNPMSRALNPPGASNATTHPLFLPLETPIRPNRDGAFTTPVGVHFGPTPDWALDFDTNPDPQFPHLTANPSAQLQLPLQNSGLLSDPDTDGSTFPLPGVPNSSFGNSTSALDQNAGPSVGAPATLPSQPASTRSSVHVTDYANLRDAIMRCLPPRPSLSHHSSSATLPVAATMTAQMAISAPAAIGAPPTSMSAAPHMHSVDDPSSRTSSMPPTPVLPPGFPLPGHILPAGHISSNHATYIPRQVLRQSHFAYDQVVFIHHMTKRWHFFLVSEDAFPININAAREACLLYAERILEVSRTIHGGTLQMFFFVRKKDSHLRNQFQEGLLAAVETGYSINKGSAQKISELLKDRNFVFVEYDPNDKRSVSGRYRHPAIIAAIKILLFPKSSRGRPVGVRFIEQIVAETPAELVAEFNDKTATSGIPVPLLALGCTMVLYALHAIRAGDWSERKASGVQKPLHFTERRYAAHYRSFVKRLKEYHRLGELRKFHSEEVMKEYLQIQLRGDAGESDIDDADDNERFSDGE